MKRQSRLLYEAANILCWFRIGVSVMLAMTSQKQVGFAVLFSLAFVSDVLDGWCYRKFTKPTPYMHWFNKLPITMDPIADFCFVGGGMVHIMSNKLRGLVLFLGVAAVMSLWNWLGSRAKDRLYTVLMTGLTYYWFVMMIITVVAVWQYDGGRLCIIGPAVTLVLFYAIWLKTRVKDRTIRRRGVKMDEDMAGRADNQCDECWRGSFGG